MVNWICSTLYILISQLFFTRSLFHLLVSCVGFVFGYRLLMNVLESQIDELVVKATKLKTLSKLGTTEVESFSSVLSDMHSSLKVSFSCVFVSFLLVSI